ncbi:MAG: hypothetical protein ACI9FN_004019 [Saprospiraceae bacterium]|jgi:uncharacterized protein (DUF1501 family)
MKKAINRRKFLGQASCAAIGSTTFLSSLFNLHSVNASAGYHNTNDYKALVCILLAGGNDSFNMLAPKGNSEYAQYATVRSSLALPQTDILSLQGGLNNGRELGLHPSLIELQSIYNQDDLAFVSNVGSLVEPINIGQYTSGSGKLPLGLFSHVDEIAHWQTSTPNERGRLGWAGRMADILCTVNSNTNISMNMSLSGTNLFQTGNTISPYTLTQRGSIGMNGYNTPGLFDQIRTSAMDSVLAEHYNNLYEVTYRNILRQSQDSHLIYKEAISKINPINTVFTESNNLALDLKVVAETIAARNDLGMSRQVFFINYGGWDHHDEVLNAQSKMLRTVDEALGQFNTATHELGVQNEVTTFSISDFGRTLTSNGNGSDHAWGGNAFVMGGAVKGGEIYGQYPDLDLGNPLDIGRGRLIPTMASDQYFAELALWFGVPKSELDMVLPNIDRFYDTRLNVPPVGFLLDTVA